MARTKQTACKSGAVAYNHPPPAKFPRKGKGKGKQPPRPAASSASTGQGNHRKQLVKNVKCLGQSRRSSDKCRVIPQKTRAETGCCHRYRPGTRALLEISYYQKRVGLIFKLAVSRIMREIAVNELSKSDIRFQASAIQAIHEGIGSLHYRTDGGHGARSHPWSSCDDHAQGYPIGSPHLWRTHLNVKSI